MAELMDNNALVDGIFVGIAVVLFVGGMAVMFNGVLTKAREK